MLAIRMQRTGRSGHAQFRVIVQDSHFHPTRGKVVAYLGSYDPHSKAIELDKDLITKYLASGAQPSDRVASLLNKEGVKMPSWVKVSEPKKRTIKNPDKLRKNRPAIPTAEAVPEVPEAPAEAEAPNGPAKADEEVAAEEAAPAEAPSKPEAESAPEAPAEVEAPSEALADTEAK